MWVQEKMVPKCVLFENIIMHIQGLKCGKGVYDMEDHVGQEAFSSNLLPKFGLVRKCILHVFPITCSKMFEPDPHFPMPNGPPSKEQNKTPLG
jgi:hypothetical protein